MGIFNLENGRLGRKTMILFKDMKSCPMRGAVCVALQKARLGPQGGPDKTGRQQSSFRKNV
jgi:hypothetical protein